MKKTSNTNQNNMPTSENLLFSTSVSKSLRLATKAIKNGDISKGLSIYTQILKKFPKNKAAAEGIRRLNSRNKDTINLADPPQQVRSSLIARYNNGVVDDTIAEASRILVDYPKSVFTLNILGACLLRRSEFERAIQTFLEVIEIDPTFADAHNNLGLAFSNTRDTINAIKSFKKALQLQPQFSDAMNNLANALRSQGRLSEACEIYEKIITIDADYYLAYSNLGICLKELANISGAISSYEKAIEINPSYSDAYFNLSGTSESILDAEYWLTKCLKINPLHNHARIMYLALQYYKGDESALRQLDSLGYSNHPFTRSIRWVSNLPSLPRLFFHRWSLFDYASGLTNKHRPFYEFGVWRGTSFEYLKRHFKSGFGFDTFSGLPEEWHDEAKNSYSADNMIPKVEGGEFIVGEFKDTLPKFFCKTREFASLINFDADLYSSTKTALDHCNIVIDNETILIFDEFLMNDNWELDEFRALEDFCFEHKYAYDVLAVSFHSKQVALRIRK